MKEVKSEGQPDRDPGPASCPVGAACQGPGHSSNHRAEPALMRPTLSERNVVGWSHWPLPIPRLGLGRCSAPERLVLTSHHCAKFEVQADWRRGILCSSFCDGINVRHCHRPKPPGQQHRSSEGIIPIGWRSAPPLPGVADLWGQLLPAAGRCQADRSSASHSQLCLCSRPVPLKKLSWTLRQKRQC
jgi:hypothetical protein